MQTPRRPQLGFVVLARLVLALLTTMALLGVGRPAATAQGRSFVNQPGPSQDTGATASGAADVTMLAARKEASSSSINSSHFAIGGPGSGVAQTEAREGHIPTAVLSMVTAQWGIASDVNAAAISVVGGATGPSYGAIQATNGALATASRFVATTGADATDDCTRASLPCLTISHALSVTGSGDSISVAAVAV